MEYVAELTRERVRYRANGYAPVVNITAPNGSNDAFYIKIDQHYGSSDHVTYMQYGIPGGDVHHLARHVVPLLAGHARQAGLDAVQAGGGRRDGRAGLDRDRRRPDGGADHQREPRARQRAPRGRAAQGGGLSGRGHHAEALHTAWKEARVAIRHQAGVEKGVIRSSRVLYVDPAGAAKGLAPIETSVDKTAVALTESVRAAYGLNAQRLNTPPIYEPPQTPDEKEAVESDRRVRQRTGDVLGVRRGCAWCGSWPWGRRGCGRCAGCRRRAGRGRGAGCGRRPRCGRWPRCGQRTVAAAAPERGAQHSAREETQRARDPGLPLGRIRTRAARRRDGGAPRARGSGHNKARGPQVGFGL